MMRNFEEVDLILNKILSIESACQLTVRGGKGGYGTIVV
jgi:hypothetical protein